MKKRHVVLILILSILFWQGIKNNRSNMPNLAAYKKVKQQATVKKLQIEQIRDNNYPFDELNERLRGDKEFVWELRKEIAQETDFFADKLLEDKDFMFKFFKATGYGFNHLSKEKRADKSVILVALKTDAYNFKYMDKALKKDKDFLKKALGVNGLVLEHLSKKLRANKQWVLLALKENGDALAFVSNMLSSDEYIVEKALQNSSWAFFYAHEYLQHDRKFVLKMLKKGYPIFFHLDETLSKDKELQNIAIKHDGSVLEYLDKNLTQDRSFIAKFLKNDGYPLYYVDEKFKKDKELVSIAVSKDPSSLEYADKNLTQDKEFLLSLIEKNEKVLNAIDKKIWQDKKFLTKILKSKGFGLKYATKAQQDNKALVLKAMAYDGYALAYASERLKKDEEVVLAAVRSYAYALTFADEQLSANKAFMKKALDANYYALVYANEQLQEDEELIETSLKQKLSTFSEFNPKIKRDKALIIDLLQKDFNIFPYLDKDLKKDAEIIEAFKEVPSKSAKLVLLLYGIIFLLMALFFYFMYVKKEKRIVYLATALLLFGLVWILKVYFVHGVFRMPYVLVNASNKYGLEPVRCWMGGNENLENLECYNVHVPEIYADKNANTITFPLRIFRSSNLFSFKAPLLHLGGGGPGASMQLGEDYALESHLQNHDAFSLEQGRDLLIIDPRGVGLSKPLLTCSTFVDNFLTNMRKNLSTKDLYKAYDEDYATCVKKLDKEHVNLNGYNSFAIAHDINFLVKSMDVEQFVLFGVSYSTTYAMIIAKKYPSIVKKMILDSACFPNLKLDHNYEAQVMDKYNSLYAYDKKMKESNVTVEKVDAKSQMKHLHAKFNKAPLKIDAFNLQINGDFFIATLTYGVYGTEIFKDLPTILKEMENNKTKTFLPYLKNYLNYMLDRTYADISLMTHYCYEDKPFIDFEKLKAKHNLLEEGYIKSQAHYVLEAKDFCKEMHIISKDKSLADPIKTEIPTLFVHGKFDSVTPLRDVLTEMKRFKNAKLLTYKTSHAVLGTEDKIEDDIAKFLAR